MLAKKTERKVKEEGKKALNSAKKSVSAFSQQVSDLKKTIQTTVEEDTLSPQATINIGVKMQKVLEAAEASFAEMKNAYGYYKKQTDFRSREMQIYRNIATLGISAAMFGHEALNQTVDAKSIVNDILADYYAIIQNAEGLEEQILDLQKDLILIDEKADFYRNYLRKEKQDCSTYVNIVDTLNNLLKQHESALKAIDVIPKVTCAGDKKDYKTWAYEGDIDSIFTNLITNAYKALKKCSDTKMLDFSLCFDGSFFTINAINNGKPIEPEFRDKIFEPMFSTYSDGTGLGLTIVQDTLQIYQGTITLEDEYPNTHFVIRIPYIEEPEEE